MQTMRPIDHPSKTPVRFRDIVVECEQYCDLIALDMALTGMTLS